MEIQWNPTQEQRKNLETLAKKLPGVPEEQFDMDDFVRVIDLDEFYRRHPGQATRITLSPDFQIVEGCGTAGCALGWSPTLVEKGRKNEDFNQYSLRVFGISRFSAVWGFLFDSCWDGPEDTPAGTARRIDYILKHGRPPQEALEFGFAGIAHVHDPENSYCDNPPMEEPA